MSYALVWSPKSKKVLGKLGDAGLIKRITKKMEEVAGAPYDFLEKVKTEEGYKVRIGDYRIIVDLDKDAKALHILTVRHRRDAYKR